MKYAILAVSTAALVASSSTIALAAKSSQDFIKDAIQGDNSEIMLGQLAQQKGGDKVKSFGQMLVTDHTTAKQQASDVAKTLGVTPPSDPMPEANDENAELSKMSGDAFDHEFASYMVTDHQKDIKDFQDEAGANDGPASMLASKQLPTLKSHLQMAQSLASRGSASNPPSIAMAGALTQEGADMWRTSKLPGVDVYGPDQKKVGGISDVLIGKGGKAEYIIVGVGGFLGMGQKDVAIPFEKVRFTDQPMRPATADTTGLTTGTAASAGMGTNMGAAPNAATGLGAPTNGSGQSNAAATTGAVSTPAETSMAATRSTAYPDHGMIDLTADQLKSAPAFTFAK